MNEILKSDKTELDWRAIDSPKKQTNEFVFFAMTVRKYLKLEISIFCKARKKICLFGSLENLQRANLLTVLSEFSLC